MGRDVRLERTTPEPVHCAPLPDWVDHQPYSSNIPATDVSCIANGLCRLLYDVQVDLSHGDQAWHLRTVQRVLTREGAERAAHVVLDFDPGFQRLEVHFIRVVRGGECIEHARPEAFQLLRRETNLERLVFDGRLSATLLIPDVRIDDIIELGLTLYGTAPVLRGKYATWVVFDSFNPWYESRQRLLRPLERRVHTKRFNDPPEAIVTVGAETNDSRWQIVGQQRRELEPLTPPWLLLRPTLQFSEFDSWNEVASLFAPHYESDSLPEALAAEVDRLASTYETPEQRAVEWLRFVQRELRYFAISLGEGGLTPRPLDAIWSTRFGDCKDATRLYTAGARRLGLDACAALVSSTHGYSLNDFIPSAAVFNHCIVRLRLNGVSYWLDPTASVQSGDLQNVLQPHMGWALPLTSQTTGLERLGSEQPLHVLHFDDEITVGPQRVSPATLRRNVVYCFWAADIIRHRFANEGTAGYSHATLKELQDVWPDIAEKAPIEVHDDPARNEIAITLSYEIRDCWRPGKAGVGLDLVAPSGAFGGELLPLSGASRETDVYLGRPRKLTSRLQLNMPCRWSGTAWLHQTEAAHLNYVDRFKVEGRAIHHSKELVIDAWSLPAVEAKEYGDIVKKIQQNMLIIWGRERLGKIGPRDYVRRNLFGGTRPHWLVIIIFWLLLSLITRSQFHW